MQERRRLSGYPHRHHMGKELRPSPADPELTMFAFTAEPSWTSDETLNLLASWTPTLDEADDWSRGAR
jgi:hypothetical protein